MKRILVVEDDRATRRHLVRVLEGAGFAVAEAGDGLEALEHLGHEPVDLVLLDVWLPQMGGLEMLAQLPRDRPRPIVIVMTSDEAPSSVLRAVREQAYDYMIKPIDPERLVERVRGALANSGALPPIEVLSARPEWVELLVPCSFDAAERIEGFLQRLKADLDPEVRESVGRVFHELLANAIEWGGQLDPNRKVRISYLRARRMLLYRIADPGPGFRFEELEHAAVGHPGQPMEHMKVRREKGIRPGGFGILMARHLVDELLYNEDHNEVVFVKYLNGEKT